jgi:hypothetical protein
MWEAIKNNPVLVNTFIGAAIVVAVHLGAPISDELKLAIDGLVTAALAILTRSQVTPVAKLAGK